ncbi:MAG: hypothetical protein ACRDJI_12070 [Actinomycetota bacterium]
MRRSTAAILAIVVVIGAAGAQAASKDSKVTIHYDNNTFSGRVTSTEQGCEAYRQVKLFKKKAGAKKLITSTPTDEDGKWLVFADKGMKGRFYALVLASDDGCDRDRSRTIEVG